jgi:hypothetical protein
MKMFWKASWVPEAAVRTTRSIGPLADAPGTWLQLRTRPEKMSWICVWLSVAIGLELFVTTQTASRAILLKTMPPGSAGLGSREDIPRVTRPRETSVMPMSEPPCRITNLTLPLYFGCLTKALASRVASGAIEVDPLIVIVAAEAGTALQSATWRRRARRLPPGGGIGSSIAPGTGGLYTASVRAAGVPKVNAT